MRLSWTSVQQIFIAIFISLAVSGCAYTAGLGDRRIPGGYDRVAVPVFRNLTQEAGAEVYFTNALKHELERSKLAVITEKKSSQVVLEGVLDSVKYTPMNLVFSSSDLSTNFLPQSTVLSTEYQILVKATLVLRRRSDDSVIWSGVFNGERTYSAPKIGMPGLNSADALYNHSAHYQNIALIASDMMIEAHDRLTENF